MKKLMLLFAICIPLFAWSQVERMPNLTASYNASQSGGDGTTWTLTGNFNDASGIYDASGVQVGDIVFFSDGSSTFFLPVTEIVDAMHPTLTVKVSKVGITQISSVGSGMKAIFHPTSKGYFPFVSGISNADQQVYNEYLMSLLDNASSCELTFNQTAHGFRKFTPIYWNGSTWARPTNDTIIPTYIVIDSTSANTFKVANCGTYTTSLTNGLYWFTSASPGYSLTADTTKVPLFQALNGKLILNPIVGFNLMSGTASSSALADTFYIIISGQSNALGASLPYDGDTTGNASIQVWDEFLGLWKRARIGQTPFRTTAHPQTVASSAGSNNLGFQFAKLIYARTGKVVRFIIVAEDGANGRGHIGRWTTTGNKPVWDRLVARVDSARAADGNFKNVDVFLWHQGESDYASTYSYYQQRFDTLKKYLRLRTWFPANTPIIVGGLYLPNATFNVQDTTLRAFDYDSDPWVAYASSKALNSDDAIHFDGESLVELGQNRYYSAYQSLPKRFSEYNRNLQNGIISELPKRDIDIVGAASSDLRIRNARIQFDGKFKIADDSTFSHNPSDSLTKIRGQVELKNGGITATNSDGFSASKSTNYGPVLQIINPAKANISYSKMYVYDNFWGSYNSANGTAVGDAWYSDRINYQWGQLARWDSIAGQGWVMDNIYGPNFLPASYYFKGGTNWRGGEFVFQSRLVTPGVSFLFTNGGGTIATLRSDGFWQGYNSSTGRFVFGYNPVGDSLYARGKIRFTNTTTPTTYFYGDGAGKIGIGGITNPTSTLHTSGSVAFTTTIISSATTLEEHKVVFAKGASTYLVTLPSASSCSGRMYTIKVNGGAKTISSFLDLTGSTSTTLTNNTVLILVSDGSVWQQI